MASLTINRNLASTSIKSRLLSAAKIARFNNPHINAVMASPPAVTTPGQSTPAGLTNVFYVHRASGPPKDNVFRHFGGTPFNYVDFYEFPNLTCLSSGNITTTTSAGIWRTEFIADAIIVGLQVLSSTAGYRFIVDGHYVSMTPTVASGGGSEFIVLDFTSVGGRAARKITLEGSQDNAIYSINVGTTEGLYTTEGDVIKAVIIGDSVTAGQGATFIGDSYAAVMGDCLGLRNMIISGSGGCGWVSNQSGTNLKYRDRLIPDLLNVAPDVAFMEGGLNDGTFTPAQIQDEVTACIQQYASVLGSTPLFVMGVFAGTSGPSSLITNEEVAVKAAVSAFNSPTVIFIPISGDVPPWTSGLGNTGAPTGVGNCDIYNTDATHPNTLGHAFLGKRAADAVMQAYSLLQ